MNDEHKKPCDHSEYAGEQRRALVGSGPTWKEESEHFGKALDHIRDTPCKSAPLADAERTELEAMRKVRKELQRLKFDSAGFLEDKSYAEYGRRLAAIESSTLPMQDNRDPVDVFLYEVRAELIRARTKFPGDRVMTVALAEEFGELCKAVLDESSDCVRKEAVQTAVMAARVALDGDGSVREWRKEHGLDELAHYDNEQDSAQLNP